MNELRIGIDIGGTRTKYGLVNTATGEVVQQIVQPTETGSAARFLQQVENAVAIFREQAAKTGNTPSGIGIGIPGFTNEAGVVVTTYGFLVFMENYAIRDIVEQQVCLPCRIDNDARTVGLGEALYGQGNGYRRVLTLTLGTGVGFGFVVNGRFTDTLPYGHMGGNMSITETGGRCYCGKTGCLEALVSSTGIAHLCEATGFGDNPTAEAVFAAAARGNATAAGVVAKVTGYLHTAIHNYANLFAPDMVVLGGGIAKGLQPYLAAIKGRSYMGPYPGYDFGLTVSELQEQAGMLGSAALFTIH